MGNRYMYNSKLDKIIDILLEGKDAKEVWHLVFNKMNNPAKRQLIGELLNDMLGGGYSTKSSMFDKSGENE